MGCCMKQKDSLKYTVLCMIACSTGILQQLIEEADGCTDVKKAAAFTLLGAGFLLYGLWESYLSELSSWIPLISFTFTALLPLCSFHWLILIPFALFSGMLLSFCLSRFLSAAPEKRRYFKLGVAFGLYASGQALYTVLLPLLPRISFPLQFTVLSVCPLFVFLLNYRNAAGTKQAHGSPRFLLQHMKSLWLASFAGLALLLVLQLFIFQALYDGASAPSEQIVRIAGFLNGLATKEQKFRDAFFTDAGLHDLNGDVVMLLGLDVLPVPARCCRFSRFPPPFRLCCPFCLRSRSVPYLCFSFLRCFTAAGICCIGAAPDSCSMPCSASCAGYRRSFSDPSRFRFFVPAAS